MSAYPGCPGKRLLNGCRVVVVVVVVVVAVAVAVAVAAAAAVVSPTGSF